MSWEGHREARLVTYLCCQRGHSLPGDHSTFATDLQSVLANRTFCTDGSVLYLHIPSQYPLATGGYLNLNVNKLKFITKIQYLGPRLLST